MGLMSQKDMAQEGARRIHEFQAETKRNKAQSALDEEARIYAQNHPDPTKEEEGLGDPMAMLTPIAGDIVDVGRAAGSAAQGDWSAAALSILAAIPFVGDGLKAGLKSMKKIDAPTKAEWQSLNKVKQRQEQLPELKQSAQDKIEGKIDTVQHQANVDAALPVRLITEVPPVPTHKEMGFALTDNKVEAGLVGKTRKIKQGERVSTRLDIPAYDNYDTWVVSVHFPDKGTKNAYAKTASLKDVSFAAPTKGGYKISQGTGKAPIAMMGGKWQDVDPKKVQAQAKAALKSDEWVQVGYNPFRHSYFYDKAAKKPVVSATELIQVGPLVLAKGVKYADPDDAIFLVGDTGRTFNEGGLVDAVDSIDDYTLDGGLPKVAAADGYNAELDAAVKEMRRKEAEGPTPTFYNKDDQDFAAYKATEEPVVATPSTAITETEEALTEGYVYTDDRGTESTRGIRNNNPLNIEKGDDWDNLSIDQSADERFAVFDTAEHGIRAAARILATYQDSHGLTSVSQMISRWAPPVENDTPAYIRNVVAGVGVTADAAIVIGNNDVTKNMIKAMMKQENGADTVNHYTDDTYDRALDLAFPTDNPQAKVDLTDWARAIV